MLYIKEFGRDRELINTGVWDKKRNRHGHTHITHTVYIHPNKVALRIKYNVEQQRLPRHSKFVKKYVGLNQFIRFVESHVRVCPKGKYRDKLIKYLDTHKNKHHDYYNVPKGFL